MFGNGKKQAAREQEQEVIRLKECVEKLSQTFEEIEVDNNKAFTLIEGVETEKKNVDNSLNRVVEYIKEIYASDLEQAEEAKRLLADYQSLNEKRKDDKVKYEKFVDKVQAWSDEVSQQTEEMSVLPSEDIKNAMAGVEEEMSKLTERMEQMTELGHQMGVISLNAAIEAGRMGEVGRKFVAAAEEVRSCAGKYQEETQTMTAQLEEMEKRLSETQKQVEVLSDILKQKEEQNVKNISGFKEYEGGLKALHTAFFQKEWDELFEEGQRVASISEARKACFGHAMQSMELAGVSFMKEQQALEQVKEQLKEIQCVVEQGEQIK